MPNFVDTNDYESILQCKNLEIEKMRHQIEMLNLDKGTVRLVQQLNAEDGQTPESRRLRARLATGIATIDLNRMQIQAKIVDVDNAIEEVIAISLMNEERRVNLEATRLLGGLFGAPLEKDRQPSLLDMFSFLDRDPRSAPGGFNPFTGPRD